MTNEVRYFVMETKDTETPYRWNVYGPARTIVSTHTSKEAAKNAAARHRRNEKRRAQ